MSLSTGRAPERNCPLLGGGKIERLTPATVTVAAAGVTLTAAQLLKKLIPLNCTDAGNLTLPTADAIVAAIPGIGIGDAFEVQFINYGDSTATVVIGTGMTNVVIDSEDAVLTVGTHQSLRLALSCTSVTDPSDPSKSNTFNLYGFGAHTAATS